MFAQLPKDPFHQFKSIIIEVVCLVLVLITAAELISSKISKTTWPVRIVVIIGVGIFAVWTYKRNYGDGS
jgi:hypothetical protein